MQHQRIGAKKVFAAICAILFFCLFINLTFAANSLPQAISITPSSGTFNVNTPYTFTTVVSDPDGYLDINLCQFMINTQTADGLRCFYGMYDRRTNTLSLMTDTGTWPDGFSPGSANTIENSYATLNCQNSSVTCSGSNITVNWSLTFKSGCTGPKNSYLLVLDSIWASSGWKQLGTVTIPNNSPQAVSITPSSGTFNINTPYTFTTVISDPDSYLNIYNCQFMINTQTFDGLRCFYGCYSRAANTLSLMTDTGTWPAGFSPGSANTIQNSYATLNCQNSSVTCSGNNIIINWNLTFKNGCIGIENSYLVALDNTWASSAWQRLGTATVLSNVAPPPGLIVINYGDKYTGQTQVTLTLSSPYLSNTNLMQFSNDNISWSTPEAYSATKIWDITAGDGQKTIYVKFSDRSGIWSQAFSDTINLDTGSPFGVCFNDQECTSNAIPTLAKEAGIRWARQVIRFEDSSTAHGQAYFADVDKAINNELNNGLSIDGLLLCGLSYPWGSKFNPTSGDDTNIQYWAAWVSQLITKYKDKIKYWEVWNEPDCEQFWYPTSAANYVKLLKATYIAAKQADPSCKILLAGQMGWSGQWPYSFLEEIYSNGGKDYFDIVAIHTYTAPASPEDGDLLRVKIQDAHLKMENAGDEEKPIWITEIGWPSTKSLGQTTPRGVTLQQQADYLQKAYAISLSDPQVRKVFWYDFRNTAYSPYDDECNYGLIETNYGLKPAYAAYQQYCLAHTPDLWTLNMTEMPWYQNTAPYNSTGAAACLMILNYIRDGAGQPQLTQDEIYKYAKNPHAYGPDLTADEMDKALGHFDPYDSLVSNWSNWYDSLPDGNPYKGYNYSVDTYDPYSDIDAMNKYMRDICHWMAYTVTKEDWWLNGELVARPNTPAAVPIYGTYNHWVVVKGCATDKNPCPNPHTDPWGAPDFTVYGFWIKDPLISGIGQDTYKTSAECGHSYFIASYNTTDAYYLKLIQVAEPPAKISNAVVKIPEPATDAGNLQFIGAEVETDNNKPTAPLATMALSAAAMQTTAAPRIKKQSWKDLVDPHLLSDMEAVAAFDGARMERSMLVKRPDIEAADYYIVPFDKRVKGKGYLTSAVILLDAKCGYFKEASWAKYPEVFLKVKRGKAISLLREYILKNRDAELKNVPKKPAKDYLTQTAKILQKYQRLLSYINYAKAELVWQPNAYSASPYKPYWKIDINGDIWYVTQEGKIISK